MAFEIAVHLKWQQAIHFVKKINEEWIAVEDIEALRDSLIEKHDKQVAATWEYPEPTWHERLTGVASKVFIVNGFNGKPRGF